MEDNLKIYGYNITSNPDFMDKENAITPDLKRQMENLYEIALEGKKSGIDNLLKLIEKHPKNPQVKNYLSVLYNERGDTKKAQEINHWIISEHPDYLFGKLNLAAEYYEKEQYEKIPEILCKEMELKFLYPNRDTFHIAEVTGFYKIAVLYFCAIDNLEEAEIRFEIIKEISPDSFDTETAQKYLLGYRMEKGAKRFEKEQEDAIEVHVKETSKAIKNTKPPVFTHPEINLLYQNGLYIEEEILNNILSLPRETLIKDLEKVLQDSIKRYGYFYNKTKNEGWNEEEMNFAVHAIFLLGELKADKSLPKIFELFRKDRDFFDLYFGDMLTNALWEPLYKIASNQLDICRDFMMEKGIYPFAKSEISRLAEQVAFHQPERKQEIIDWFKSVLEEYYSKTIDDNIIDSDLIGLIVWQLLDLDATELLPLIKKLYDKGIAGEGICGTYDDVEKSFNDRDNSGKKEEIMTIAERYKHIVSTWAGYNVEEKDYDDYETVDDMPLIKPPNVGRNDPCPCGSGKKYKKCCLNKN